MTACGERPVRIEADLAEEAVRIAEREQISVSDAAYVAAARREGDALVSRGFRRPRQPGLALVPDRPRQVAGGSVVHGDVR